MSTASDWIGWLCVALVALAGLAIGGGHLAARWPDLRRWWRAVRSASANERALRAATVALDIAERERAAAVAEASYLRRQLQIRAASRPRLSGGAR